MSALDSLADYSVFFSAMAETPKINLADHAREISFAVFRVAKLIEQPKLKVALESAAVELVSESGNVPYVSYVPSGESLPYLPYIEKLINLVRLAELIEEIKPVNVRVLVRELSTLKSVIAESVSATYAREKLEDINLEDIFRKGDSSPLAQGDKEARQDDKPKLKPIQFELPKIIPINFDNAVTRQSAILDFIKQLPNGCRMKDLMTKFTSVSERTLRNDLQILTAEDKIERFGAVQGPFSYFRVKTTSPAHDLPVSPETGLEPVTKNEIISL